MRARLTPRPKHRRAGAARIATILGVWALLSQPAALLLHNAVPHTHADPRGTVVAAAATSHQDGHDHQHDHDHPPGEIAADHDGHHRDAPSPARPAPHNDDWCPTLQALKVFQLDVPLPAPTACDLPMGTGLAAFNAPVYQPATVHPYDIQPRAPPIPL